MTTPIELLIVAPDIIAIGPFTETELAVQTESAVYPKTVIPGWEIVLVDTLPSTNISVYQYVNGQVVPKRFNPPDTTQFDKLIAAKNAEINRAKEQADNDTFPFKGEIIDCNIQAKAAITGICGSIALCGCFPVTFPYAWKTADNKFIPIPTIQLFRELYDAMVTQGIANFLHAQDLKTRLAAITPETVEDLALIVW